MALPAHYKKHRGISLIEFLALVTLFIILAAIFIVPLISLLQKKNIETAAENMINVLRHAQSQALSSKGEAPMGQIAYPSDWGAHFDLVNLPLKDDRYWIFRGSSYPGGETQEYLLPQDVRISRLELGTQPYLQLGDIVFPHLSGEPQTTGSIVLAHRVTGEELMIAILPSGEVKMGASSISSDPSARISDTRHVHASLIRSIPATATLTFDYPDPASDESVLVSNAVSGVILDYTATANSEAVRTHTHTPISDASPLFSINRDGRLNALPFTISIDFDDGMGAQAVVSYNAAGEVSAGPAVAVQGGETQLFIQ